MCCNQCQLFRTTKYGQVQMVCKLHSQLSSEGSAFPFGIWGTYYAATFAQHNNNFIFAKETPKPVWNWNKDNARPASSVRSNVHPMWLWIECLIVKTRTPSIRMFVHKMRISDETTQLFTIYTQLWTLYTQFQIQISMLVYYSATSAVCFKLRDDSKIGNGLIAVFNE